MGSLSQDKLWNWLQSDSDRLLRICNLGTKDPSIGDTLHAFFGWSCGKLLIICVRSSNDRPVACMLDTTPAPAEVLCKSS